jgi:hypothetical protein
VVIEVLMAVGVGAIPLPALALGARGLLRRSGRASTDARADRLELVLLVLGRLLALLVLCALTGITLLACVGALIKHVSVPSLVYVFFVADLLVATLVLLTFGRHVRRPRHRPATPAPQ